ncbi:NAD(P)H-binding protein [Streptomyces sp. NPDC059849]|uniref:NAD(P)H-binding protein n=1 Tax=Streptomyces sp. NPDC059849 TaxID=3346969 RepID=UPI0036697473
MCGLPTPCRSLRTPPWPLPDSSRRCRPACRRRSRRRCGAWWLPGAGEPTVDHGAVLAVGDAAQLAGVRRFLLLSAMGSARARSDPADQLRADLPASQGQDRPRPAGPPALDCTVIRPGWFRDGPSTGLVHLIAPDWPGPGGGGSAPPRRTSRPPPPSEPVEAAPAPTHDQRSSDCTTDALSGGDTTFEFRRAKAPEL